MPVGGHTQKETVKKTVEEWRAGELHSGRRGKLVLKTKAGLKRALAIGYNYARKRGK